MSIQFEKIIPDDDQIERLYTLLEARAFAISHTDIQSFDDHVSFVKDHPYIDWFIVKLSTKDIGTLYSTELNTIGINVLPEYQTKAIGKILQKVRDELKPLPAIKSVRPSSFCINVPTANKDLMRLLEEEDLENIQTTYRINN